MQKRSFNTNIEGRVKKFTGVDFLVPLYEAVTNSIHAIEDHIFPDASIQIEIIRNSKQLELDSDAVPPITGFVITDTGIGFNRENIESFCIADSSHKANKGGKGIGRFTWLRFFEKCRVESVFQENGKINKRVFNFSIQGVEEEGVSETKSPQTTRLILENLFVNFQTKSRRELDEIVISIVEHFITYLVTEELPKLVVIDGAKKVSVQDFFAKNIQKNFCRNKFTINGIKFTTTSFRFYLGTSRNFAFLCGNKRVALKVDLGRQDHFFSRRFTDEDLRTFAYHVYIESPFLDAIVNDDREGFKFPEFGSLDDRLLTVSQIELVRAVVNIAFEELKDQIASIKEDNIKTVQNFIGAHGAQYRHLFKDHTDALAKIHDSDPIRIDTALRRIQFDEEVKTRSEVTKLLNAEPLEGENKQSWRAKSKLIFEKLNDTGKANLAQYIVQRRYILDLVRKTLEINDEKFAREEVIHELIFPMKSISDEVSFEDQNLWIIDERLSYHQYLASDKPLSTTPGMEIESNKEPDILIFNTPIALNDRQEHEAIESIVIIEFKRPGHSPVKGQKDPVRQVLDYVDLIRSGKAKSRTKRDIKPSTNAYFFGYVICEIDEALRKALVATPMQQTPDGRGYFGYFPNANTYLEVISYDKMLDDAFKRNRILFEKVQMPTI